VPWHLGFETKGNTDLLPTNEQTSCYCSGCRREVAVCTAVSTHGTCFCVSSFPTRFFWPLLILCGLQYRPSEIFDIREAPTETAYHHSGIHHTARNAVVGTEEKYSINQGEVDHIFPAYMVLCNTKNSMAWRQQHSSNCE
jgi:hypothetical protein